MCTGELCSEQHRRCVGHSPKTKPQQGTMHGLGQMLSAGLCRKTCPLNHLAPLTADDQKPPFVGQPGSHPRVCLNPSHTNQEINIRKLSHSGSNGFIK